MNLDSAAELMGRYRELADADPVTCLVRSRCAYRRTSGKIVECSFLTKYRSGIVRLETVLTTIGKDA